MRSASILASLLLSTLPAAAQDLSEAWMRNAELVRELLTDAGTPSQSFVEAHVAAELRERAGVPVLTERLEALRAELAQAELNDIMREDANTIAFVLGSGLRDRYVFAAFESTPPNAILDVWIEGGAGLDPATIHAAPPLYPPLTFDNLVERMAVEKKAGFSGALLVVRDGASVLEAGYGLANHEERYPVTPYTIFAIGSTPIDFTKAAILQLIADEQMGLEETLGDFFEDVPEDKRAITVEHLMTGASGLQNFHDLPGDRDPDHSWIDRDEAVRRILAMDLLFAPGHGNEHSHSAWGLLAAIVELRSQMSYQDYTRTRLFEPAGMTDTGFFGAELPPGRVAIGYGPRSDGSTNAPPFWGKTSWLVMGSGGMTSTLRDMQRWELALRAGKLLAPQSLERFWSPPGSLLSGGDSYGFEIMYTEHPETYFILLTNNNTGPRLRAFRRLSRELYELTTLGVRAR